MALFVSTSRKPRQETRKLAKWLARFLGETENRGKRSVDEVVARAENKGFKRLVFVYERGGRPCELVFFENKWLEPSLRVKGARYPEKGGGTTRIPAVKDLVVVADDAQGEKMKELLGGFDEPEGEPVEMHLSKKKLYFVLKGRETGFEILLR